MAEVWIAGGDLEELHHVTKNGPITIKGLPWAEAIISDGARAELLEALQSDLIVLQAAGKDPHWLATQLEQVAGSNHWRQRKAQVVIKTQDSHHQADSELASLDFVDYVAIAHGPYLTHFPEGRAIHSPCAVELPRRLVKQWVDNITSDKSIDVVFPFYLYRGEARNAIAYQVAKELKRRGHSFFFGRYRYYQSATSPLKLWEEMARAKVVLNLPLRDDLNIRSFEASLFPTWQVTVRVPDHDVVRLNEENMSFVSPNPLSIADAISDLLEHSPSSPSPTLGPREDILSGHLISDRIMGIIDQVLGTSLLSEPKKLDGDFPVKRKPLYIEQYSSFDMLEKSPLITDPAPPNSLYSVPWPIRLLASLAYLVSLPKKLWVKLFDKSEKIP